MKREDWLRLKKNTDTQKYIRKKREDKTKKIRVSKCGYCGKKYVKLANKQKYCSNHCRESARLEQSRIKSHRWYHRHKHELTEKQRWGLGSGVIGQHAHKDFDREQKVISKELRRLGIRKNNRYKYKKK